MNDELHSTDSALLASLFQIEHNDDDGEDSDASLSSSVLLWFLCGHDWASAEVVGPTRVYLPQWQHLTCDNSG